MWGVTALTIINYKKIRVSIHTPVWGVTVMERKAMTLESLVSIHTPVWGVTMLII